MFTTKKIAIVSVINDLATDQRVNKTCKVLMECGFEVVLVGRKLPNSLALPSWPFKTHRFKLLFKKGPFFYFFFNLRLFLFLLFKKADLLYANDLDTLLPNYIISRLKKTRLMYDSHELFCEVPELANSSIKKKVWLALEKRILPRLKTCITVNESIATIYSKQYKVEFHVIRNIPETTATNQGNTRIELGLPEHKKIILLQGAGINMDRGAEELIEAMNSVKDAVLYIIGSGDSWPILKIMIHKWNLETKVTLINKLPKEKLLQYTLHADLGISIDKNTNLNYYYSLPNKIFDYIHSGVPVLASHLPEVEKIIKDYGVGDFILDHQPENIAAKINEMLTSPLLAQYRHNTEKAKKELSWEIEKLKLKQIIRGNDDKTFAKSK